MPQTVRIGVVDGGGAALFAAGADASLDALLLRGLSGACAWSWPCGRGWRSAARALGQNGVHGWKHKHQQKGKTTKRTHRYWDSSMGVAEAHHPQDAVLPPFSIKSPWGQLVGWTLPDWTRQQANCRLGALLAQGNRISCRMNDLSTKAGPCMDYDGERRLSYQWANS